MKALKFLLIALAFLMWALASPGSLIVGFLMAAKLGAHWPIAAVPMLHVALLALLGWKLEQSHL